MVKTACDRHICANDVVLVSSLSHLNSCLADMSEALRVCGMPYLMPTPTRGSAFTTFFTVDWSENANIMDAAKEKAVEGIVNSGI